MASLKEKASNLTNPSALTVLTAMLFWGQVQNYMMRINLSILIVAMVKPIEGGAGVEQVAEESCVTPDSGGVVKGGGATVENDLDGQYMYAHGAELLNCRANLSKLMA